MKKTKKQENNDKKNNPCPSIEEIIELGEKNNKLKLAKPISDIKEQETETKDEKNN